MTLRADQMGDCQYWVSLFASAPVFGLPKALDRVGYCSHRPVIGLQMGIANSAMYGHRCNPYTVINNAHPLQLRS